MNNSGKNCLTNKFSHLYVEKRAWNEPLARQILERFPDAARIEVEHYKEVFSRSGQHFQMQKKAMKLILAVKQPPLVYRGAEVCHDFGQRHFYYTSSALNCLYNCDYCFLQGMFPSGHVVFFVNLEDYFQAVDNLLKKHPVYLCISYEADLLAFENLAPFCSRWIEFARKRPDLLIEIRTKSANYAGISRLRPADNVVLAWTLSPQQVIDRYEPGTPPLAARLRCMQKASADGWPIRICFDPVLPVSEWQEAYRTCIDETFTRLSADRVRDISIGVFRVPKDYLKKMRKARPDSELLHYPFECREGVYGYPQEMAETLLRYVREYAERFAPTQKIYTE